MGRVLKMSLILLLPVICLTYGENLSSMRILKGVPRDEGVFIGGNADIISYNSNGKRQNTTIIGTCFDTGEFGCNKTGNDPDNCKNYIRDVSPLGKSCNGPETCRLYFSGTNALFPRSFFCNYDGTALSDCEFDVNVPPDNKTCLDTNIAGTHVFQRNRDDNATSLYQEVNGVSRMFYGVRETSPTGRTIIGVSDIDTTTGELSNPIITQDTDKHLYDAEFIGEPFVDGDYTYFLFRERSVEFESLSFEQEPLTKYYSRIARVCSNDAGVTVSAKLRWTSFVKQRLVCHKETNDAKLYIYYDHIQDFELEEFDDQSKIIHAIFTNERNAAASSAQCSFNLTDIVYTFHNGDYYGTASATSIWKNYDGATISPLPGEDCADPAANTDFLKNYALMKPDAMSVPLFTVDGVRFSVIEWREGDIYVMLAENGRFYEFQAGSSTPPTELCLDTSQDTVISDFTFMPNDTSKFILVTPNEVKDMEYDGSSSQVVEVPANDIYEYVRHCKSECMFNVTYSAMDEVLPSHLWEWENLDSMNTTVCIKVRVLQNTTITFTGSCNIVIKIIPKYEYTEAGINNRQVRYDNLLAVRNRLIEYCPTTGIETFNSSILSNATNPLAVSSCDDCPYAHCDVTCN